MCKKALMAWCLVCIDVKIGGTARCALSEAHLEQGAKEMHGLELQ